MGETRRAAAFASPSDSSLFEGFAAVEAGRFRSAEEGCAGGGVIEKHCGARACQEGVGFEAGGLIELGKGLDPETVSVGVGCSGVEALGAAQGGQVGAEALELFAGVGKAFAELGSFEFGFGALA